MKSLIELVEQAIKHYKIEDNKESTHEYCYSVTVPKEDREKIYVDIVEYDVDHTFVRINEDYGYYRLEIIGMRINLF